MASPTRIEPVRARDQWIRRPQSAWLRRVLFQIHVFIGIAFGLYFVFVSLTGSALVLYLNVLGADDTYEWLAHFHGTFLLEQPGLWLNGGGGVLLAFMGVSGAVIWWPGIRTWQRGLTVPMRAPRIRFIWRLHSATGFWAFLFIVMFGATGAIIATPRIVDQWLASMTVFGVNLESAFALVRKVAGPLHGGPSQNLAVQGIWGLLALAPTLLVVTGTLLWWRRVIRPGKR